MPRDATHDSISLAALPPVLLLLPVLWLFLVSPAQAGSIYYFKDDQGVLHFTNMPESTNYRVFAVFQNFPNTSREDILRVVRDMSRRHRIDHLLVQAVIQVESNFDPKAVSSKGAQGAMQLMPGTGADLGVREPFNLEENIEAGVRYLRMQLDRFGDVALALAAYNAGPQQVERYHGVPPFAETRDYVTKVLTIYRKLKGS